MNDYTCVYGDFPSSLDVFSNLSAADLAYVAKVKNVLKWCSVSKKVYSLWYKSVEICKDM